MEHELIQSGELTVVGTTLRTKNAEAAVTISAAWHRFLSEGFLERIEHRIDAHTLVAVYTDYASDENGAYTFMVGAPVSQAGDLPEGTQRRVFPAQRSAKIRACGRMPDVVQATWRQIYSSALRRSFSFDYERYDARRMGPDAELEIFVGLEA